MWEWAVKYKYSILNTSRWESETIAEWVQYYLSIGFEHLYLYCNDESPDQMYRALMPFILGQNPSVTFHHLPYQGQQDHCWVHFLNNHKDETEWFMFVDADEFLALKGSNNIHEFMKDREKNYDSINFGWVWFGPMEFDERPGGSTLLQYNKRQNYINHLDKYTKSINRSSKIDSRVITQPPQPMLNHLWPEVIQRNLRSVDVLGYPFASFSNDFPHSAIKYLEQVDIRSAWFDTAIIYHYIFRSKKDLLRRIERGLKGAYWYQTIWQDTYNSDTFEDFLRTLNDVEDNYLRDYWSNELQKGQNARILTLSRYRNIAPLSTPTQSSTCIWSSDPNPSIAAKGGINQDFTGGDGFHTDQEQDPWWMTELDQEYNIREIRLFNSMKSEEIMARTRRFHIDVSMDGVDWETIFTKSDDASFGGVDGRPYIIRTSARAKYVRIQLNNHSYFQLDEVEIYTD